MDTHGGFLKFSGSQLVRVSMVQWSNEVHWASKKAVTSVGNSFDLGDPMGNSSVRKMALLNPNIFLFFVGKMMATI
jgi:hypothetical protein